MAASPAVAERIGLDGMHFVRRQLALLPVAILLMFTVSLQSPKTIRRVAVIGFLLAMVLVALTFVAGVEIKGARRWINLPGLSLQPSEFVKPTFAVVTGWLLAEGKLRPGFPGPLVAALLYAIVIGLLVRQPDLGMAVVISALCFFTPRHQPYRSLPRSGKRRQLPGRPLDRSLHERRTVGQGSG